MCDVLEVGFRHQFRLPPMTGDSSAFVDKGSITKRTVLRSLIQSMQQNYVVEVVHDTATPGFSVTSSLFREVRRMEISHRPLISQLLSGHSYSAPVSHDQSTDSLIPAHPRMICSYVANPARSLCVHRKTGSSGTATHCEALHCISQHWDFNPLTSNLWIPLFPRRRRISNCGRQHTMF